MATALAARTVALIERALRPGNVLQSGGTTYYGSQAHELITALNAQAAGTTTTALSQDCINAIKRNSQDRLADDLATWIANSTSSNTAVTVGTGTDTTTNISSTIGHDAKLIRSLRTWLGDRQAADDIVQALGG